MMYRIISAVVAAIMLCLTASHAYAQNGGGYTPGSITLGQSSTLSYFLATGNNNLFNTLNEVPVTIIIPVAAGGATAAASFVNCNGTAAITANDGANVTWQISNATLSPFSPCTANFVITPTVLGTYNPPVPSPVALSWGGGPQVSGNITANGASTLTVLAAPTLPTVTLLNPTSGLAAGGGTVTITGTNFTSPSNTNTVTFGMTAATGVTYINATTLTAIAPAGSLGTVNVSVSNANGASANNGTLDDYTYAAPTPVPTLSEWAMILFGLILAGSAALYIQRRQLTV